MSYLAKDDLGQDVYLSLLSDWDLDAAFFSASDPYLRLEVDLRPFEEGKKLVCVCTSFLASPLFIIQCSVHNNSPVLHISRIQIDVCCWFALDKFHRQFSLNKH